ncbi:MAG: four helix bundle protein [bacterium]|nr:four helix bundle protein [bacterium]
MQSYKDLLVWQKSISLVTDIYHITEKFPKTEVFGLTSQMRRAAVSIPANIAEGYTRKHKAEYVQFLRIAFASGAELETHLIIAANLGFTDMHRIEKTNKLLEEIMKMLNKLISVLVAKP